MWKGISGCRKQMKIIPLTIFWLVGNERNRRAFNGVEDVDGFDVLKNGWF